MILWRPGDILKKTTDPEWLVGAGPTIQRSERGWHYRALYKVGVTNYVAYGMTRQEAIDTAHVEREKTIRALATLRMTS